MKLQHLFSSMKIATPQAWAVCGRLQV